MSPFGAPPFAPPFGTPFGMFPFAQPQQHHWDPRWPWPNVRAEGGPWSPWSWLTSSWPSLTSWWSWLMSLWPRPMPAIRNNNPAFESMLRSAMTAADFWYHCFETMAQMAYQARRAYQFFMENGGPLHGQYGPMGPPVPPGATPDASVDMNKLRESLKFMDPMQAAQVLHAVQMMQAMELMQRRQRSRANGATAVEW
jgi:hypothetical protein